MRKTLAWLGLGKTKAHAVNAPREEQDTRDSGKAPVQLLTDGTSKKKNRFRYVTGVAGRCHDTQAGPVCLPKAKAG